MSANARKNAGTQKKNGAFFGLTEEEVKLSREKYGANALKRRKRKGFFRQYLSAFSDPIIRVLLIALAVNLIFFIKSKNVTETAGIAAAVFLSTFVSTLSEYGSESAFEQLMAQSENAVCRVRRGGKTMQISVRELVTGDILLLEAGERVPADVTLLSGKLTLSQSPLTGESAETEKTPEPLAGAEGLSRREKAFEGSLVTGGEAIARVSEVGENTFYGQMASALKQDKGDSPLKRKLSVLAGTLSRFGYLAAVLVALADLFNAFFLDNAMNPALIKADFQSPFTVFSYLMHALTLAIAVVVVAVPEGLPMMIAVVLSSNRAKMAKDNVLVKRAAGIEAAGGMRMLFTDKTGTLTRGAPSVARVLTGRGELLQVENIPAPLAEKIAACAYFNGGESAAKGGGNAADRAFRAAFSPEKHLLGSARPCEAKILSRQKFNAEKKYALTAVRCGGEITTYFQGAPEILLPHLAYYFDGESNRQLDFELIEKRLHEQTSLGRRVIALACYEGEYAGAAQGKMPENAALLALAVLCDELRPEARAAVDDLRGAGVQVVMITGDHPETAAAIAKDAGLFLPVLQREKRKTSRHTPRECDFSAQNAAPQIIPQNGIPQPTANENLVVLTGGELAAMSDEEVLKILPRLRVVARALPTDKSRLVKLSQRLGYVTGMTGDGINDAAALKKADVGFALGSGTEVAKEAGDVVITNDNLSSVVKAAAYGRRVFKSIRQFVVFQLTMNLCAVGVSLLAPFIGFDTPVTVMQMLWINMIMDTLASLAFAGIRVDPQDMRRPPVPLSEPVLTKRLAGRVAATGIYCVLLCLYFLKSPKIAAFFRTGESKGTAHFYTAFFSLFVFSGLFGAFHARTDSPNPFRRMKGGGSFVIFIALTSLCQIALLYCGGAVFRTSGLSFAELILTLALSATVLPVGAIVKLAERPLGAPRISLAARKTRNKNRKTPIKNPLAAHNNNA